MMLEKARLTGEVLISPKDKKPIHETIKEYPQDARRVRLVIKYFLEKKLINESFA